MLHDLANDDGFVALKRAAQGHNQAWAWVAQAPPKDVAAPSNWNGNRSFFARLFWTSCWNHCFRKVVSYDM